MTPRFLLHPLLLLVLFLVQAQADEFDSQAFMGMTSGNSVGAAIKRGEKDNKRVLVFAYDEKKNGQAFHIKGMLELEETKKLVREHFILVITDFKDRNIRDVIGSEGMDRPVYFLFNTDGSLVQKGTAAMGAGAGAKLVKEWTSK
ncbi:hypothetical protein GCM10023213_29730 [Prosthecobacter algae]|uniref:Uncharacterized protein n=1 Tax=Prosthecobacter algae TaxID=1144682 RepID=A0ABP9PAE8_9BACT